MDYPNSDPLSYAEESLGEAITGFIESMAIIRADGLKRERKTGSSQSFVSDLDNVQEDYLKLFDHFLESNIRSRAKIMDLEEQLKAGLDAARRRKTGEGSAE